MIPTTATRRRGANIRIWRTTQARIPLTPEQVAAVAEVSRQTVTNWENGSSTPRADQIVRLEKKWPGFKRACGLA
jgi:transcriptional regulator with XRE-family HTH domain